MQRSGVGGDASRAELEKQCVTGGQGTHRAHGGCGEGLLRFKGEEKHGKALAKKARGKQIGKGRSLLLNLMGEHPGGAAAIIKPGPVHSKGCQCHSPEPDFRYIGFPFYR